MGAWCVPCGANTGEAETVVVRAVRRKAVVMKAVSDRMDRAVTDLFVVCACY